MINELPLISIALCTYNGEKYLIEQLDSLVNQTYKNFEIIAIDDNSSDNSFSLLESYSKNYPLLKAEKNNKNLGFTKNFEKAILKCNGNYIAISDQDDIWDLNKLEKLCAKIGDNMLIYHNSALVDSAGKPIENLKLSDRTKPYTGSSNIYFVANNSVSGHATMFKRELLKYVLPFDERFYYDWWIAFVAISIGKIIYIPDDLVKFRQHGNNVSDILALKGKKVFNYGNAYIHFDLDWIKKLSEFNHSKNKEELKEIYSELKNYTLGKGGIKFLKFLIKYTFRIFYLDNKKSKMSRLNLIRKIFMAENFSKKQLH